MKIIVSGNVPLSAQAVKDAPVFRDWAARLDSDWRGSVTINVAGVWGGEVQMLQMSVAREGKPWPEQITLRSETVDVLTVVTDGNQSWVVFVEQEREAAGGRVYSNPAGGREWSETAAAASHRELREELGLESTDIRFDVELSELFAGTVLATPGITNERVYMMKATIWARPGDLDAFLEELRGKKTGVTAEGEDITLTVVPAQQAREFIFSQSQLDAKTLLSLGYARL